jgi:hypothetical protein
MGGPESAGPFTGAATGNPVVGSGKRRISKPILAVIVAGVVVIGAAAYYFGYYNSPAVIYSSSLKNTAKGYDKLINYAQAQSKLNYKSTTGSGSFSFKNGETAADGKLNFKGDDNNSQLTFDVGAAGTRVSADLRFLKSAATTPDIFVKASGLKGLGALLGSPDLDAAISKVDDTWIVIDHTLFDSLSADTSKAVDRLKPPTSEQVFDEFAAFGQVNRDYLFTNDNNKAVMKVVKNVGREDINGRSTYHYKVALQKDHVKNYISAQQAALKKSKLNAWLKQNHAENLADSAFEGFKSSSDHIKTGDTFDIWMDTSRHTVYKVRFSDKANPAVTYTDFGLDYKGGDNYPFFITGQSDQQGAKGVFTLVATLNSKANSLDLKLNAKEAESFTLAANFNLKPGNETIKIDKPVGAKTLAQLLNELGYGDLLSNLQSFSGGVTPDQALTQSTLD